MEKSDAEALSRRSFLQKVTAVSVAAMHPTLLKGTKPAAPVLTTHQAPFNTVAAQTQPNKRFIAIQVGAVSFVDEGVEQVLDILQEKGSINAHRHKTWLVPTENIIRHLITYI